MPFCSPNLMLTGTTILPRQCNRASGRTGGCPARVHAARVPLTLFLLLHSHAQSLAALQAYSHWLAQFYSEVHRQNPEQFISLVSTALEAITPLISSKVSAAPGAGAGQPRRAGDSPATVWFVQVLSSLFWTTLWLHVRVDVPARAAAKVSCKAETKNDTE